MTNTDVVDTRKLRDSYIKLPTADNGYTRVMFVGTTGAGKTSLLRQLIGSHPKKDRFPATSTAKTTICDIEVIQSEGTFQAAVTFLSKNNIRVFLEECLGQACLSAWEGESEIKIADKLLKHENQKFRLNYVLGDWKKEKSNYSESEDDWDFGVGGESLNDSSSVGNSTTHISDNEKRENQKKLENYVSAIKRLASRVSSEIPKEVNEIPKQVTSENQETAEDHVENFIQKVQTSLDFNLIIDNILGDISYRFHRHKFGMIKKDDSGWPILWKYHTKNRGEFIKQVRWFSSNHSQQYGRLLTPLVDGIRVKGPLFSEFDAHSRSIVYFDGQGLGHTPGSAFSISTNITRHYDEVDVILVVDNAQNPMQAAPLAVLRSVISGGHSDKLAIAFTHFDLVEGDNLPDFDSKRDHVRESVTNVLNYLETELPASQVRSLKQELIDNRCYMLGAIYKETKDLPKGVIAEMKKLLKLFNSSIGQQPTAVKLSPIYEISKLEKVISQANVNFQIPWQARLGYKIPWKAQLEYRRHKRVQPEHWSRIKALNRRIAGHFADEYDNLKPVADLIQELSTKISHFLDCPTGMYPRKCTRRF